LSADFRPSRKDVPADMAGAARARPGPGLVIFAVVLLGMTDSFNLIDSIAAVANSPVFAGGAH